MSRYAKLSDLGSLVGRPIGLSGCIGVDQERIDSFAHAIEDARSLMRGGIIVVA